MSNEIASGWPALAATSSAPTTPAAGPETSAQDGCAAASSRRRHAARRAHHERRGQSRTHTHGREPFEIRGNRQVRGTRRRQSSRHARTRGTRARSRARRRRARQASAAAARPRRRVRGKDPETRTAGRLRPPPRRCSGSELEVERLDDAVRPDALTHAEAALERHQRLGMIGAEPVQMGAVLPAQVEEMLEPGSRDERGARALALEQSVGRHRRAVREALDAPPRPPHAPRRPPTPPDGPLSAPSPSAARPRRAARRR